MFPVCERSIISMSSPLPSWGNRRNLPFSPSSEMRRLLELSKILEGLSSLVDDAIVVKKSNPKMKRITINKPLKTKLLGQHRKADEKICLNYRHKL